MAFYLVSAVPKQGRIEELGERLARAEFVSLPPFGATLSASSPIVGHTLNLHYFASDSFMCRISFDAGATRPDCLWLLLLGYAIPEQSLRQWGRG